MDEQTRQLANAREREAATREILRVISRSPGDYGPVFKTILDNAIRLCGAPYGTLLLVRGEILDIVADTGLGPELTEFFRANPHRLDSPGSLLARAVHEQAPQQRADPDEDVYRSNSPMRIAAMELGGIRTLLGVPIINVEETIGVIALWRQEVKPFADDDIELVSTFADQAAIAIENVRQFKALEARTADLTNSLERQTATSEILRSISQSPTDYAPIFDTILANAVRLCGAPFGTLFLLRDGHLHVVADAGSEPAMVEHLRTHPMPLDETSSVLVRAVIARAPLQQDLMDEAYHAGDPRRLVAVDRFGCRTWLGVPLLKSGEVIGAIALYRKVAEPFADDDVALVSTFADQAVIAIENVRLFQALETRTSDLTQSLERQTATSEILRSISQSPTDYAPVFNTILENATRMCVAPFAGLSLVHGDVVQLVANVGARREYVEHMQAHPVALNNPIAATSRAAVERVPVQLADLTDEARRSQDPTIIASVELEGIRTVCAVPMLKGGETIGVITLYRREVEAFAADDVELVRTFADQAVIAIENVRQFQVVQERTADLTQSLERQTATSEILRSISQSPTDYAPVFNTILDNAIRLCGAPFGGLFLLRDDHLQLVAYVGARPEYVEYLLANPLALDNPISAVSHAAREQVPWQITDLGDTAARSGDPYLIVSAELEGIRTVCTVPILKGAETVGVIALYRREIKAFEDDDIALVSTFADQAVIAIENVRLFQALESRNAALGESLERQTATSEILRSISRSPTDYEPVFDTILESATRLCDAPLGQLYLIRDGGVHLVANRGSRPEFLQFSRDNVRPADRKVGLIGTALSEHRPVHADNFANATLYRDGDKFRVAAVELEGVRSAVSVPLLKGEEGIGAMILYRREVRPFEERHVSLVETFADQAVIAIENVRLFNETREALERQTASADILKAISDSPTDVQPVFDAITRNALKLCDGVMSGVFRFDGEQIQFVAQHGWTAQALESFQQSYPRTPAEDKLLGRAVLEGQVVNVADILTEFRAPVGQTEMGHRSVLAVPLLREGVAIGAITVARTTPGLFLDRQVELVTTFADQAVIAIENVRLFQALEARTTDLTKTLERQTATGEILRSISQSPTDYAPVFDTILENAIRLCGAPFGILFLLRGDHLHVVADAGSRPEFIEHLRTNPRSLADNPEGALPRTALDGIPRQVEDLMGEGYETADRKRVEAVEIGGIRTLLTVPMRKGDVTLGLIVLYRQEVKRFADDDVELVTTFADQAVIAIENVRMFQALEGRTTELTKTLERQTATSEILRSISRSPTDYAPVFDTILDNATRLCEAPLGLLFLRRDEHLENVASIGAQPAFVEFLATYKVSFGEQTAVGQAAQHKRAVQVEDVLATSQTDASSSPARIATVELEGARTFLAVPMLRDEEVVGVIAIYRREVRRFDDSMIELLETFADQAVIAIENVRLFQTVEARSGELAQSVAELEALGDIAQAVSSSLDVDTVLDTIVTRAVQLSRADAGAINEFDEATGTLPFRAAPGMEHMLDQPAPRLGEGAVGRAAATRAPVQIADITVPGAYTGHLTDSLAHLRIRALLAVPMMQNDQVLGALVVARRTPGEFPPEAVRLLRALGTQSAIAIRNARLFREIEDKGRELEAANRHKSEFLANMSHELRTPLNAVIGFSEVLGERMFGDLNDKQAEYVTDIHDSGRHLLSLINDILDLSKIEAGAMELDLGRFALAPALENALTLVRERAERRGINLQAQLENDLGEMEGDERKLKQILLNLLSNAIKFTPEGGNVTMEARQDDAHVHIAVRDTGVGISEEDLAVIFEEFKQVGTDYARKVEGTGLGLTLTKRFVEMHGGHITVTSEPGAGSVFAVVLPLRPVEPSA